MDIADITAENMEIAEALRCKYQVQATPTTSEYCLNCLTFTGGPRWCCHECEQDYSLRLERHKSGN